MSKLMILSRDADEYINLIQSENLPNLEIVNQSTDCDIVLGEPKLIRDALPTLSTLKWAQSIYAARLYPYQRPQRVW